MTNWIRQESGLLRLLLKDLHCLLIHHQFCESNMLINEDRKKKFKVELLVPYKSTNLLCQVVTKIHNKHEDFDFEIVNIHFLDGDVPNSICYKVYISQLIRFARASSHVAYFNTLNKLLTEKLLKQGLCWKVWHYGQMSLSLSKT